MYCPKTGKQQYATRIDADVAMRRTVSRRGNLRFMNVYCCEHCGWFHFGSDVRRDRAGKLRKQKLYRALKRYERLADA